jgi:uncharacterized protein (TIGR02147 family)
MTSADSNIQGELPSIYGYIDFRAYLSDYQKARVEWDPDFSGSGISRLLGMPNTRSYFSDVIKGRKVSTTFVERFVELFRLDDHAGRFFRALVKWNQADYQEDKEACFEQLVALNRTPRRDLLLQEYRYYKDWHNSVIRAILNLHDFRQEDCKALGATVIPAISAHTAQESLDLLLEMGLIAANPEGFLKPTQNCITSGGYAKDEIIRQYQLQCLEAAKRTIIQGVETPHNVSTNIISVSKKGYSRIEKRMQKFKEEVRSIVHKDADLTDRIYQITLTLLPLSK